MSRGKQNGRWVKEDDTPHEEWEDGYRQDYESDALRQRDTDSITSIDDSPRVRVVKQLDDMLLEAAPNALRVLMTALTQNEPDATKVGVAKYILDQVSGKPGNKQPQTQDDAKFKALAAEIRRVRNEDQSNPLYQPASGASGVLTNESALYSDWDDEDDNLDLSTLPDE